MEELYFPHDSIPLYLDKTSETLKVLQKVRDEAHRYGITRHRNKRSKKTFTTELETIPGIGKKTIEILLNHFKSVSAIRQASEDEIQKLIGDKRTSIIVNYFKTDK